MDITGNRQRISELLGSAHAIAVVGASPRPERDSNEIARYLLAAGYRVIPVNPGHDEILGQKCYPDLRAIPEPVELVDIFRAPEHTPAIIEDAIAIKAGAVWFQLGTTNEQAAKRADEAGLLVVRDT